MSLEDASKLLSEVYAAEQKARVLKRMAKTQHAISKKNLQVAEKHAKKAEERFRETLRAIHRSGYMPVLPKRCQCQCEDKVEETIVYVAQMEDGMYQTNSCFVQLIIEGYI